MTCLCLGLNNQFFCVYECFLGHRNALTVPLSICLSPLSLNDLKMHIVVVTVRALKPFLVSQRASSDHHRFNGDFSKVSNLISPDDWLLSLVVSPMKEWLLWLHVSLSCPSTYSKQLQTGIQPAKSYIVKRTASLVVYLGFEIQLESISMDHRGKKKKRFENTTKPVSCCTVASSMRLSLLSKHRCTKHKDTHTDTDNTKVCRVQICCPGITWHNK